MISLFFVTVAVTYLSSSLNHFIVYFPSSLSSIDIFLSAVSLLIPVFLAASVAIDVTKEVTKIRDIIQYNLEGIYKHDHKCPNCKEIKQIYFMEYQEILNFYDINYFQKMKLKDYFEPSHFEFEENC